MAPTCTGPTKKGSSHCQVPEETRFSSAAVGLFGIFNSRGGQKDKEEHNGGCLKQSQGQRRKHHLHQQYCCLDNIGHLPAAFLAFICYQKALQDTYVFNRAILMAAPWLQESVIMSHTWQRCNSQA